MLGALHLASFHAAGANIRLANVAFVIADRDLLHIGAEDAIGDFV